MERVQSLSHSSPLLLLLLLLLLSITPVEWNEREMIWVFVFIAVSNRCASCGMTIKLNYHLNWNKVICFDKTQNESSYYIARYYVCSHPFLRFVIVFHEKWKETKRKDAAGELNRQNELKKNLVFVCSIQNIRMIYASIDWPSLSNSLNQNACALMEARTILCCGSAHGRTPDRQNGTHTHQTQWTEIGEARCHRSRIK